MFKKGEQEVLSTLMKVIIKMKELKLYYLKKICQPIGIIFVLI